MTRTKYNQQTVLPIPHSKTGTERFNIVGQGFSLSSILDDIVMFQHQVLIVFICKINFLTITFLVDNENHFMT